MGHAVTDRVLVSKVTSGYEGKVEGAAAEVMLGIPADLQALRKNSLTLFVRISRLRGSGLDEKKSNDVCVLAL